jgi:hypothetical protein
LCNGQVNGCVEQALGQATIYNPPHCINFDRGPTKKARRSPSSSTMPEVHVTIQNITPESIAAPSVSASTSHIINNRRDLTAGPRTSTPDIVSLSDNSPTATLLPKDSSLLSPMELLPPAVNEPPQPMWSPSILEFTLFPSARDLLKLVDADKPGQSFNELIDSLLDAGIYSSELVLIVPEDVLGVIGGMGLARARILRNYAKRAVLPLIGLHGNYKDPEVEENKQVTNETDSLPTDVDVNKDNVEHLTGMGQGDVEYLTVGDIGDIVDEDDTDTVSDGENESRHWDESWEV